MFGLFRRPRQAKRSLPTSSWRPAVEQLEDRMCPAAPAVLSLMAQRMGNSLMVSGQISDESPSTVSVALGGALSVSVTPDSMGMFSYTTTYTSGSQVTAIATDNESLTSNQATANLQQGNPNISITLSVTYGTQKQITLTGVVNDSGVNGRMVYFSGAATGWVTCDANGNFTKTLTANSLGTVTASVSDAVNQNTATANVTLTSTKPTVYNFTVSEQPGGWFKFTGTVSDESPAGLTVYFGGVPVSLMGKTDTVDGDGTFTFWIQLNGTQSDEGLASVYAKDWWGINSDTVTTDVHQSCV